jgi:hypothetical protein
VKGIYLFRGKVFSGFDEEIVHGLPVLLKGLFDGLGQFLIFQAICSFAGELDLDALQFCTVFIVSIVNREDEIL